MSGYSKSITFDQFTNEIAFEARDMLGNYRRDTFFVYYDYQNELPFLVYDTAGGQIVISWNNKVTDIDYNKHELWVTDNQLVDTSIATMLSQSNNPLDTSFAYLPEDKSTIYYFLFCLHDSAGNVISSLPYGFSYNYVITDVDGNQYPTMIIGNAVWTVENLKTTKYNDGVEILQVSDSAEWEFLEYTSTAAYTYPKHTTDPLLRDKYGALYNWYTVNTGKLAPPGWRVATDIDWILLENHFRVNGYNWDGTTTENKLAKSIASKTDWMPCTTTGTPGWNMQSNNNTGFNALPGTGGEFGAGTHCHWWTSTIDLDYPSQAFNRNIRYHSLPIIRQSNRMGKGRFVRLVKE